MKFRFIDTDLAHPYFVTAADEAISTARKLDIVPDTLHLYRRKPPAVSVGRFRSIKEIDVEECKKKGIVIVRRISGGGTIYTDEGCLIYSIVCGDFLEGAPKGIFERMCKIICKVVEAFGLEATYKRPNDVIVNGKKISGSAILKKGKVTLVHGTIIVSSDIPIAKRILPNKKIEITSLSKEMNKLIDIHEVKRVLLKIIEEELDAHLESGSFTSFERKLTQKLMKEKFCREEWNLRW